MRTTHITDAYELGSESFLRGESLGDNPYVAGNLLDFKDWSEGWEDASENASSTHTAKEQENELFLQYWEARKSYESLKEDLDLAEATMDVLYGKWMED